MSRTILILGPTGRMGRNAATAFRRHGWTVRSFDRRGGESLIQAAEGAELIFNGWNPPYPRWAAELSGLTAQIIEAARASGAAVLIPGNVYTYGTTMPPVIGPGVPQAATNPLGRLRVEMEATYRDSGVKTVILRAGDYLDTEASGNWFDMILARRIGTGRLSYPGALDTVHAWAFLPDVAEAFVRLADRSDDLPEFSDLAFEGYSLTARELAAGCEAALGRPVTLRRMSWLPIRLARPVWPVARHLIEMRYLWTTPHRLDGSALHAILPDVLLTPLPDALGRALAPMLSEPQVQPDKAMV